jgi:parvulin-like peptidyl-prolyl isomerase
LSNLTKGLILVIVILAIGGGLVVWKKKVSGSGSMSFNSISKEEMELLLSDVAKTNPMVLKRLKEDPEMKKQQLESLKQLLAFASQAQHDGLTDDASNKQELQNIKAEVEAVNYDREINKDKGPMPAFGFISEDQVKGYWDNAQPAPSGGFLSKIGLGEPVETRSHEDEFNDFLNAKVGILKAQNPDMANREITDEEKTQARDIFAKTRLYRTEYETKAASGELAPDFVKKTNLQVKLQQAQFLARLYSDKVADQLKVTDEEVDAYIKAHPELDPETKKAQAQQILDRAKAGEDFAALANQFTQDPGNAGTDGQPKGGLYEGVRKGQMVPPFENAALALEPGQVSPELVQSDFGYHIIKLERKLGPSGKKDANPAPADKDKDAPKDSGDTYDVRHILISTGFKDPDNPTAREQPVKDYVRSKLEDEKQKAMIDKIVAQNNVSVAEDFAIPEVTDEQIQQMRQNQRGPQMPQNMPPPGAPEGDKPAKPDAKKPDAKKK